MTSSATAATEVVIRISDLLVRRGEQTLCRVPALSVGRGERLGIVGPNGTGKSTLLRVLAGLERETAGVCQVEVSRKNRVFMHQSPYLFQGSVLHNVQYGLAARSIPGKERREMAADCLSRLGIADLADRPSTELSGGEVRRIALARACVCRPQLLLLDEPLADLDEAGVNCLSNVLRELTESTILMTSPTPFPPNIIGRCIDLAAIPEKT